MKKGSPEKSIQIFTTLLIHLLLEELESIIVKNRQPLLSIPEYFSIGSAPHQPVIASNQFKEIPLIDAQTATKAQLK